MAEQREHTEMSEVIAKAMAEAMWIAIQTMAEMQLRVEETQQGPKIGSPVLKQPQFSWDVTDKVFGVESLHVRGKKCIIHLQHIGAW